MLWGGEPLTLLAFLGKRKINNLELEVFQWRETNGSQRVNRRQKQANLEFETILYRTSSRAAKGYTNPYLKSKKKARQWWCMFWC